ncbi:MAG: 4-(cytidine 5'-diphospho)-2-C-methyl-D-erythritol kinase [Steroidobacteraceae bacterium]|nr:4-(cytidine 5'-diphospho)-2-C-methyl-D-erythritol kinase [Steroidobacteraceae bacterium]MCC7200286.1 4-(cytidine 5'-diphospho)-2-C-methyl-D-erythritol kinase [Gammaproteobacteria bacterium]
MSAAGWSRDWPAPAKLNLFLHVVGRRADGYHELQTLFQIIDLQDTLAFRVRADAGLERLAGAAGVDPRQDLVIRAARRLQEASGCALGADITVEKRIPMQGGLGGGSSDAATTLVALNELWGLHWPLEDLASLGLALGADVPVFVLGRSAWAEGVGEVLTPVDLPPAWYAVIRPNATVPTAEVFQAPELTRNTPTTTIRGFLLTGGRNDCAPVVVARHADVGRALEWLGQRGEARLTGTGSCVFAAFGDRAGAAAALAGLPAGWLGFVAQGLDHSPLSGRAAAERQARAAGRGADR